VSFIVSYFNEIYIFVFLVFTKFSQVLISI